MLRAQQASAHASNSGPMLSRRQLLQASTTPNRFFGTPTTTGLNYSSFLALHSVI
jgi:hypothetical protein